MKCKMTMQWGDGTWTIWCPQYLQLWKRCTCPLEWQQSIIPSWTSWTLVNHLQCRHLWKLIAYGFLCFSSFWNESFKINNFWHLKKKKQWNCIENSGGKIAIKVFEKCQKQAGIIQPAIGASFAVQLLLSSHGTEKESQSPIFPLNYHLSVLKLPRII